MSPAFVTVDATHYQTMIIRNVIDQKIAVITDDMDEGVTRLTPVILGAGIENAQMRQLQNVAFSTEKISDITDWIKRQIGRSAFEQRWRCADAGERLLNALTALRRQADGVAQDMRADTRLTSLIDDDLARRVHLRLCREFVKHLVADYLYQRASGASRDETGSIPSDQ